MFSFRAWAPGLARRFGPRSQQAPSVLICHHSHIQINGHRRLHATPDLRSRQSNVSRLSDSVTEDKLLQKRLHRAAECVGKNAKRFEHETDDEHNFLASLGATAAERFTAFSASGTRLTRAKSKSFLHESRYIWSIEEQLRQSGHRFWGFVIYRCTYSSDVDWHRCLGRIMHRLRRQADRVHNPGMRDQDRFRLTVMEDRTLFDAANLEDVRRHFQTWAEQAVYEEQGSPDEMAAREGFNKQVGTSRAQRYRYCLQIDEASIRSILGDFGPVSNDSAFQRTIKGGSSNCEEGWLTIIDGSWNSPRPVPEQPSQEHLVTGGKQGDYDHYNGKYPPVEGSAELNVGCSKIWFGHAMPYYYYRLRDSEWWYRVCVQPWVI